MRSAEKDVLNNKNRVDVEARFIFLDSFIEQDLYNRLFSGVKTELMGV